MKLECARKAITYISNNDMIGLGSSATIKYMIDLLADQIANGLQVQFVTSSFVTRQLLIEKNLPVQSMADVEKVTIYFDGCDQFDANLNALKSGGGIHTREKLLASMATQFILLGDESKQSAALTDRFPVVLEVLPEAMRYVPAKILQLFPHVKTVYRITDKKEGLVVTDNGNYLMDVWFAQWPNLQQTNTALKNITGVVDTSLFIGLAHKAIVSTQDERIVVVERKLQDA